MIKLGIIVTDATGETGSRVYFILCDSPPRGGERVKLSEICELRGGIGGFRDSGEQGGGSAAASRCFVVDQAEAD
jgi:hypothetical protein